MSKPATPRLHLVPGDDELPFHLTLEGEDQPVAMLPTLRMALIRGMELAESSATSLVIHRPDGRIRAVLDGGEPDDLDVIESEDSDEGWKVVKAHSGATIGTWEDRNDALEHALGIARARGARVTLRRDDDDDLVWRNATLEHVQPLSEHAAK